MKGTTMNSIFKEDATTTQKILVWAGLTLQFVAVIKAIRDLRETIAINKSITEALDAMEKPTPAEIDLSKYEDYRDRMINLGKEGKL